VHGVLSPRYADAFGFTQAEVTALAAALGRPELTADLGRWYDGYSFGGQVIYNPWSVLNFAAQPEVGYRPYWVFTSSDDALRGVVLERGLKLLPDLEVLLAGGALRREVEEHVVLRDLDRSTDAVWSLLLHAGYLTAHNVTLEGGRTFADLVIPNTELRYVYDKSILSWVEAGLGSAERLRQLHAALLGGDEEALADLLSRLVARTLSYHDVVGPEPERVYQAFVLGMLVALDDRFEVRSNRESGYGRYDVMVLPRSAGQPGVVIEFKQLRAGAGESVEQALAAALAQIDARRYADELAARGAAPILRWGVVFDGKRVWVRRA
jgi:hypothetical protein